MLWIFGVRKHFTFIKLIHFFKQRKKKLKFWNVFNNTYITKIETDIKNICILKKYFTLKKKEE